MAWEKSLNALEEAIVEAVSVTAARNEALGDHPLGAALPAKPQE